MARLIGVKIRNNELSVPIIQGGMGVGISLSNLAGHVMKEGGLGVISAAHPGYRLPAFRSKPLETNCFAIHEEAKKARVISEGNGLLGINIMAAAREYESLVRCAVDAKYDVIISGAGLPLDLPRFVENPDIALGVIVSSKRAALLLCKAWHSRYQRVPDLIVIEGSEAGGHLGFSKATLMNKEAQPLEEILVEVLDVTRPYETEYGKIPVFVAGGVYTHEDIVHFIQLGASGVQMGTRFIATHECDGADAFKQMVIHANAEDIDLVHSPAGFPGRALVNPFVKRVRERGNINVKHCIKCLTPCNPQDTPYCITEALIQSALGNVDYGLVFVGSNAYRIKELISVHDLMQELQGNNTNHGGEPQ